METEKTLSRYRQFCFMGAWFIANYVTERAEIDSDMLFAGVLVMLAIALYELVVLVAEGIDGLRNQFMSENYKKGKTQDIHEGK